MNNKIKRPQDVAIAFFFELQEKGVDLHLYQFYKKYESITIRITSKDLKRVKQTAKIYKIKEISVIYDHSIIITYQIMRK
jgi:hypothetical protein